MSVKITQPIPPNVVEIGNEISQGVVDGLMSASPSPSSSNPFVTVNGLGSMAYLPLSGGTMAAGATAVFTNSDLDYTYTNTISGNSIYIDSGANSSTYDCFQISFSDGASSYCILGSSGITFPDNSIQTTAAVSPDLTGYLTKADNLNSVASKSSARTNLGLAYATDAETIAGTSASTVLTPAQSQFGMLNWIVPQSLSTAVATGTVVSGGYGSRCQLTATASGQYAIVYPSNGSIATFTTTGNLYYDCNFSKRIKVYGRIYCSMVSNLNAYYAWGRSNNTPSTIGSPAAKGFGIRIQGTGAVELQVHNGTTLTNVTSSFTPTTNTPFDCLIDSIGDGNVYLYINGSQVASSSSGPQGTGSAAYPLLIQELSSTGSNASAANFYVTGKSLYFA